MFAELKPFNLLLFVHTALCLEQRTGVWDYWMLDNRFAGEALSWPCYIFSPAFVTLCQAKVSPDIGHCVAIF
jgi:hypothetical protein